MLTLNPWFAAVLGLLLAAAAILQVIWWRQQSFRWPIVAGLCLTAAPALSWWSGVAFLVEDYRAGCDGLCRGGAGAPAPFILGRAAGGDFLPGMFAVNCLVYLVLLLGWSMVLRTVLRGVAVGRRNGVWLRAGVGALLLVGPFALSPLYLPPPEAHVRGDSQRIAINAQREVYLYDQTATALIMRVALADVRPRRDGQPGMRVCLRTYTWFYLPAGYMVLDMGPEGVHSSGGGVRPPAASCWD